MEFPHGLMIGGAFLVFVGFIGAALQKNERVAADPVNNRVAGEQPVSLPNFLTSPRSPDPSDTSRGLFIRSATDKLSGGG